MFPTEQRIQLARKGRISRAAAQRLAGQREADYATYSGVGFKPRSDSTPLPSPELARDHLDRDALVDVRWVEEGGEVTDRVGGQAMRVLVTACGRASD